MGWQCGGGVCYEMIWWLRDSPSSDDGRGVGAVLGSRAQGWEGERIC